MQQQTEFTYREIVPKRHQKYHIQSVTPQLLIDEKITALSGIVAKPRHSKKLDNSIIQLSDENKLKICR